MVWAITLGIVGALLILMAVAFRVAERVLDAHERRMEKDPFLRDVARMSLREIIEIDKDPAEDPEEEARIDR